MTIAVCYLSREGAILGADSTTTNTLPDGSNQYFDNQQKVLEIGTNSSLGIVTWGLGGWGNTTYRTMVAEFGDQIAERPPHTVERAARLWANKMWEVYNENFADVVTAFRMLEAKALRSPKEEEQLNRLRAFSGGFCLAGRMACTRRPAAVAVTFGPDMDSPQLTPLTYDAPRFWGVPNLIQRLLSGFDQDSVMRIINSPKWNGTPEELVDLLRPAILQIPGSLPLREAIDWVFSSIFITIKAIKFSSLPPVCGGPIEIGVVSSDRQFRWVRHKGLDEPFRQPPLRGDVS